MTVMRTYKAKSVTYQFFVCVVIITDEPVLEGFFKMR